MIGHYIVQSTNNFHTSEIQEHKRLAIPADALLREDRAGARAVEPDDARDHEHERPKDQQGDSGQKDVLRAPADPVDAFGM